MNDRKPSKLLVLLIFILSVCMFYYNFSYFSVGSYRVIISYAVALVLIGVCAFAFLVTPDVPLLGKLSRTALSLTVPAWTALAVTFVLWVLNRSPMAVITGGFSDILYQLIAVLVALSYVMIFREKAPIYQIVAMCAANLVHIVLNYVLVYGVTYFAADYLELVKSFGMNSNQRMISVEINDLTFALGLYVVFFLIKDGKIKGRFWLLLMTAFLFSVGLKRIAVIGVGLVFLIVLLLRRLREENQKRILQGLSWLLAIAGFVYIFILKNGIYETFAQMYNINTMGRSDMMRFIDQYYYVGPTYRGYGLGYIGELLQSGAAAEYGNFTRLHNDYIMMYVELGFWGYILWLGSYWVSRIRYLCKNHSVQTAMMAFACILYCYLTYLTDNTYVYFDTNVALFTAILSCSIEREKETIIQEV